MTATHDRDLASEQAVRAEALEGLLIEKGILSETEVDHYIETWSERVGPMIGARVVARAWVDEGFQQRLREDATTTVAEVGVNPGRLERLEVVVNEPGVHNVVCCTLCSCYPWTLLGLPPGWYKSPEYRSRIVREPRAVLAEMGLELEEDTTINSWTPAPRSATSSSPSARPAPRASTRRSWRPWSPATR